jgi:hypothetical protein
LRFDPSFRPELLPAVDPRPISDWLIRYGDPPDYHLAVARGSDHYLIRSEGVADFRVTQQGVEGVPVPGVPERAVYAAFSAEVLPILHQLDGTPALHASAVAVNDQALAFAGPSGRGKSTIAALLSADPRFSLLADDSVALDVDDRGVWALPSSGHVRLRPPSAHALGEAREKLFDKFVVPRPTATVPKRLSALFELGAPAETVRIETMRPRDAVAVLAAHAQRLDPTSQQLLRAEFDFLDRVASGVRVASLRYPHDFDARALTDALLKELAR